MTASQTFRSLFNDWPKGFPRRGVVLSTLNETIPFSNFWLQDEVLLLERKNPDTSGARYIIINFDGIDSVRLIDPIAESVIKAAGFSTNATSREAQLV